MTSIPKWVDVVIVPIVSLLLAAAISALVMLAIGENPWTALKLMITGALGSSYGWGYTLYYTTNFIFTGLAVAIAFHARIFNIGGEGQAALGGLGLTLFVLNVSLPHWSLYLLVGMAGSALFGAAWAYIPAILQAKRGSHVVITTIMFNFIAAAVLNMLLVGALKPQGAMEPSSAKFAPTAHLPTLHEILAPLGIAFSKSGPANISLFVALIAAVAVWYLIWRTRLGYEMRAFGHSEAAALYAGISPTKIIVVTMLISGGLAGMMALNTTMGEAERLLQDFTEGAGFIGIAVALMGRSHPIGVVLAALLFGFLYQGGAELAMWTSVPREMILVIQALVILFTGALDNMVRMPIIALLGRLRKEA